MSWDSYIDNVIAQSKDPEGQSHTDKACIIGLDGGAAWTTSAHASALKLTPQEGVSIARIMKGSDKGQFKAAGIMVEGVKYMFLREDDDVVMGKKKDNGAITIQKSKTAVMIAHTPEGCQQGLTNKAVAVVIDYLAGMNM